MLQQLGEHILAAKERARLCAERARTVTDATLERDLLDLEKAWLDLASSFETLKSLENFLLDSSRSKGVPDSALADGDRSEAPG
jgi:hypothetical protein